MLTPECLQEFRSYWLPHITDCGLDHLIDLLEKDSPYLIHGSFARAVPQGCLATQIAWHHPKTEHLTLDAGVCWLNHVAGLNPATSQMIRAWDKASGFNFELRTDLLAELKDFRRERRSKPVREPRAETCGENRIKQFAHAV